MEQQPERKKRILSAIQPSGIPTLGNYLGALKNWVSMSEAYDCAYAVADLHAITVRQNPAELRRRTLELYALLLAIGLDPEKNLISVSYTHLDVYKRQALPFPPETFFGYSP